ncbi:hypothetical protein [Nocardia brevicatena]|nr:hypothetical protein [Nocardia brevicatena]
MSADGIALVVTRAGQVAVLHAGQTVWCPPGENIGTAPAPTMS